VFNTQEVLGIAREAEDNAATKRGRKEAHTTAIDAIVSADESEVLEIVCSSFESDCMLMASSRAVYSGRD
jgi:hypothetical protein